MQTIQFARQRGAVAVADTVHAYLYSLGLLFHEYPNTLVRGEIDGYQTDEQKNTSRQSKRNTGIAHDAQAGVVALFDSLQGKNQRLKKTGVKQGTSESKPGLTSAISLIC